MSIGAWNGVFRGTPLGREGSGPSLKIMWGFLKGTQGGKKGIRFNILKRKRMVVKRGREAQTKGGPSRVDYTGGHKGGKSTKDSRDPGKDPSRGGGHRAKKKKFRVPLEGGGLTKCGNGTLA